MSVDILYMFWPTFGDKGAIVNDDIVHKKSLHLGVLSTYFGSASSTERQQGKATRNNSMLCLSHLVAVQECHLHQCIHAMN